MPSKALKYSDLGQFAQGGIAALRKVRLEDGTIAVMRSLQKGKLLNFAVRSRFRAGTLCRYRLSPHPNIVNSFEHGTRWWLPYELIEFVNGVTLRSLLGTRSQLLKKQPLALLIQMAQGLSWVHEHGFMHLDVKPENFLVVSTPSLLEVKLTDFDLSRAADDHGPRRQMGTPGFMAPEQFVGRCAYQASDVFAFGLIAYQMLCGKTAFTGDSPRETWRHQASSRINARPIHELVPSVHPGLEKIIMGCLAKKLSGRPRHMMEVLHALNSLDLKQD